MANRWVCLTDQEINSIKDFVGSMGAKGDHPALSNALKKMEKSQKRIAISSAKDKGRMLQKWVCEKISKLTGIPYNQQDDNCLIHGREMGQAGVDVVLRGKARRMFPFDIECKSTEQLSLISTIHQAQQNTAEDRHWMIVHKCKALPIPIAIMSWETFEAIWNGDLADL
jgi:hypothetical protein